MTTTITSPAPACELSSEEYEGATSRLRAALVSIYPTLDGETLQEVVQDAWTALYSHQRGTGTELEGERRANFLFVAARNAIIDRGRRARRRQTDLRGQGAPLDAAGPLASPDSGPEDQVLETMTARELEELVNDELSPHQQAVFRLRYFDGLEHRQIRERLGVSERSVCKALERSVEALVSRLFGERHWLWEKGRRALVVSVLAGTASKPTLAHAQKLAARDGALAQALRDAGTTLHGAAAAIPAEAVLRAEGSTIPERITEAVTGLTGRSDVGSEAGAMAGQLAASGTGRGAGAAGAGVIAKFAALGGAGKAAVACLATSGVAATCMVTGVVRDVELGGGDAPAPQTQPAEESSEVSQTPDAVLGDLPPSNPDPVTEPPADEPSTNEPEASEPESGLAPPQTPSEQVQQEFDLAGAAQPVGGSGGGGSSGGGSSGSGGGGAKDASGSQVATEFGP